VTRRNNSDFHISWMTVSYRSVKLAVVILVLLALAAVGLLRPGSGPRDLLNKAGAALGLSRLGAGSGAVGPQQAHFTALDGTVKVKKASTNTWVSADFSLPLDKNDVVQTSSEGMAKIFFSDGTGYTVKPDSLIVIQENSANAQQQTQVAVEVNLGTVDLSTGTYAQGSKSQVILAGATASLAPESSAVVHNDPRAGEHEFLLKTGSGRVTRNAENVALHEYEKVSFKTEDAQMTRSKEIGPPTLIAPAQTAQMYTSGGTKAIDFSWSLAANSHGYRLRISRNPYFSSTVYDRIVPGTDARVTGLKEGQFYWMVSSLDLEGRESVESEHNQFMIVQRTPDATMVLDLDPFVQHGHVIYLKGKTEPGARVMVNGQEVPLIRPDGTFDFFTPPLSNGENTITVTAQNTKGGVKTQQKKVVIE
jgi:hypothetical protein